MDNDQSPQSFFEELLIETGKQYLNTPLYGKQLEDGNLWNYSVCGTPILKNKPILFGINWGGSNIEAQVPTDKFDDITEYSFIKRIRGHLETDLNLDLSKINFNYTNLCFFRSPKGNELKPEDYRLSIPLFERYVCYISPPWLLSVGNTQFNKLLQLGFLTDIVQYENQNKKINGYAAKLWGWDIYSVPHPNAHLSNAVREEIWPCATSKINEIEN